MPVAGQPKGSVTSQVGGWVGVVVAALALCDHRWHVYPGDIVEGNTCIYLLYTCALPEGGGWGEAVPVKP